MSVHLAKRRKTSTATQQTSTASDARHEIFTQWAQAKGVEIRGVKPANLTGRGYGLVTTRAIQKGERVIFVPEKAMFKPDKKLLTAHKLDRASPQAQLAISALARSKAAQAPLATWQATWPTADDFEASLPMTWDSSLRDHLPPSVHQPLQRQLEDYRKDWASVTSLCQDHGWTEAEFKYLWMIVNSRSFHWKPFKGSQAGSMVMCPFIDYLNHGPSGTTCEVFQRPNGYEVLADQDYGPDTELLATYGSHANDKLLVHYGFILPSRSSSTDDDIRLDHLLLPQLSKTTQAQLQDVGFLGSYALLPSPRNELCFKTHVAVRAVLLSCNEWEYFVTNGEDLRSDQTHAVHAFVAPLLREYRHEAQTRVAQIAALLARSTETKQQTACSILKERWEQIASAIDTFLTS
nr:isoform 4 of set domain-containing protein 4 [Quercus suber]